MKIFLSLFLLIGCSWAVNAADANSQQNQCGIGASIVPKDGKLVLSTVFKGYGADAAGLKSQDVLLQVNDTDVSNLSADDAIKLLKGGPDSMVKVTVLRNGQNRMDFIVTRHPLDIKSIIAQERVKQAENLGKPVPIKFTAVDGGEVDLASMKGKVVLVDFWATWCGPCVAEIPDVKAAYEKYHSQGFQIVGISFDRDKTKLEQFVKDNGMPWQQYFDGKGWQNQFGLQFGINSIPTMWLIGKDGNLADVNARDGLADKVQKLLQAN